jgi:hypothetical protein
MLNILIKNKVHRWAQHLQDLGHDKPFINRMIASIVKTRGPLPNGCTCNNWGPRWIEDSEDGCCPACFQGALESDQEMKVNGVKPVTMQMVAEAQSWGFNVPKLRELRYERLQITYDD